MRVLVLGGTRFIGPMTVEQLVKTGHEVLVFHRGQSNMVLPSGIRHLYGDRKNLSTFSADFRSFAPDVVLDMFARAEADGHELVELFGGLARRLVVISSVDVYRAYDRFRGADPGPPDPAPATETSPLRDQLYPYRSEAAGPEDAMYHYDKILVERAAMSELETLPTTVLRLPMVYGPGDYQHRLWQYLKRMDEGRPYILLPEDFARARLPRGYVEDIGDAIARCITSEHSGGRVFHVAEADHVTEFEWVQRIAAAAGWQGEIVALPDEQLPESLRLPYDTAQVWTLNSSAIRRDLGYTETTAPDDAMRKTVAWERENPPTSDNSEASDYEAEDEALAAAGLA